MNKPVRKSLNPHSSSIDAMVENNDHLDTDKDGAISEQELATQEIYESVNGADGSYHEILGGDGTEQKTKKNKKTIP